MKYTYKFSKGENTIEINEKWTALLNEFDRAEKNNNRAETRRHYSLDINNEYGLWLKSLDKLPEQVLSDKTDLSDEEKLHIAVNKLKPKQKELITAIYFQGMSVNDYAKKEGVHQSAISHRLKTAKNNLKKFL